MIISIDLWYRRLWVEILWQAEEDVYFFQTEKHIIGFVKALFSEVTFL